MCCINFLLQDDAELDMECLSQYTVQLVKEVTDEFEPSGRRSTSYKDGYSPQFILRNGICAWLSRSSFTCAGCTARRSGRRITKSQKGCSTCTQRYERGRLEWE